jgi:RNA polymerase sigma-70 factor (ECF subfamily)
MRDAKLDRLFRRFRDKGDVKALSRVFDLTSRELLELAAHVTRDASAAEDLLQATFLVAIEHAERYEGGRGLMPWLVGILTREAKLWNRRAARRIEPDRLEARVGEDPASDVEARELSSAVLEALDKLPALYRDVIVRCLRDGRSASDIARELDRSPGTVRVQIHRGLELLRKSLPAGLVAGGVIALSSRGLAAVRAEVVKHATISARTLTTSGAASTALTTLIEGSAVNKHVLIAATGLAALFSWLAWNRAPALQTRSVEVERDASNPLERDLAANVDSKANESREPAAATSVAPEPTSTPTAVGSLLVHVTWRDDGSPAAGIGVDVSVESSPYETVRMLELSTGSDGTLRVPQIEAGPCSIDLDRGSDAASEKRVDVKAGEETRVDLSVPPGVLIEGTVVDKEGAPVPGAGLWLSSAHRFPGGRIVGMSDADGRFRLRGMRPGATLGARSPRFAPSDLVPLGRDPTVVKLELLDDGGSVMGTVRDATGAPVDDARVLVGSMLNQRQERLEMIESTPRRHAGSIQFASQPVVGRTDAQGRFSIDGCERGDVPIVVQAKGRAPWAGTAHVDGITPASVDVRVQRGSTLSGNVRRADGTPASGVQVEALGPTLVLSQGARTNEHGDYVLAHLAPGEFRIFANAMKWSNAGEARTTVSVGSDTQSRWDAVLPAGLRIAGRLLDERDAPLAGWRGIVRRADAFEDDFATTDADGRFEFARCDDVEYSLEFRPPDANFRTLPVASLPRVRPGPNDVVVHVSAEARTTCHVRGRILGSDGRAIGDAKVSVSSQRFSDRPLFDVKRDTGQFDAGPLPSGSYELYLASAAYPLRRLAGFDLAPNQLLDLGDLVQAAPGRLHARVRAPDGGAARDIRARLEGTLGQGPSGGIETVVLGSVDSSPLEPGAYALFVRANGSAATRVPFDIRAGEETSIDVALAPGIERTLRFRLPDGDSTSRYVYFELRDASGAALVLENCDNTRRERTVSHTITLAPGDYSIEAYGDDHLRASARFSVSNDAAASAAIDLRLEKRD